MMKKVLGQEGAWDVINGNVLQIYPIPVITPQEVILEFRALDSDTIHPAYRNWIQNYALACAKGALGQIRGKYQTVPSPGGGARLNGDALIKESAEEKEKLFSRLIDEFEEPARFSTY